MFGLAMEPSLFVTRQMWLSSGERPAQGHIEDGKYSVLEPKQGLTALAKTRYTITTPPQALVILSLGGAPITAFLSLHAASTPRSAFVGIDPPAGGRVPARERELHAPRPGITGPTLKWQVSQLMRVWLPNRAELGRVAGSFGAW